MEAYLRLRALLLADDPVQSLDAQREQVFTWIPELRKSVGFVQRNPYHSRDLWNHTLYAIAQLPPDETLRLAMLLHDIGKLCCRTTDQKGIDHFYGHERHSVCMAAQILPRLGVCRAQAEEILTLIALHDLPLEQPKVLDRLRRQYEEELLLRLLLIKKADILAQNPEKLANRIEQLRAVREQITAVS